MAERRARGGSKRPPERPIPCDPIDLLAGLGAGVELCADEVAAGSDDDPDGGPATISIAEAGRLVRSGESTVRRLIRRPTLEPTADGVPCEAEVDRAGVLPRTRERPGE